MPHPKFSLQFAFSWSVYFSNRTESYLIFGRSRPWSARLYLYKSSVCLSVCLFVCFLSATRHLSTLRRCLRVAESRSRRRERPHARGQAHAQREHARACRTTSQQKNRCADAFQKQLAVRARVCCRLRNCRDFQKKTNMPLPKFSLQFAFSWSVYFSNRTESYSSQIKFAGPHGITKNQATYLHSGGEARAKKRARPPAKRGGKLH